MTTQRRLSARPVPISCPMQLSLKSSSIRPATQEHGLVSAKFCELNTTMQTKKCAAKRNVFTDADDSFSVMSPRERQSVASAKDGKRQKGNARRINYFHPNVLQASSCVCSFACHILSTQKTKSPPTCLFE